MSFHGTIQPTLQRDEQIFVHGQGWTRVVEYIGGVNEINGYLNDFINAGWEVSATEDTPYWRLIATSQSPVDNPNDYYDRFTFTKEIIEKDIWTNEDARAEQEAAGLWTWDQYKAAIESALDTGDEAIMIDYFGAFATTAYPSAWGLYLDILRGASAYEDEYLVLTRERVVGFEYGGDLLAIPQANNSLIYTTDQLKQVFGIPNFVGITWPVDPPTTPYRSKWGWRNRRREIRFQEGNRIELVQDWAYAAWSLFAYDEFA